jgi:hypothetical protein
MKILLIFLSEDTSWQNMPTIEQTLLSPEALLWTTL